MIKRLAMSIAAGAAVLSGVAMAGDTIDAMIGSKVVYTYANGSVVVAEYSDDGTYTTDVAGGGSWTVDGDELCIKTDDGDEGCTNLAAGKGKGDSWEGKDAFGNDVTISIE